MASRLDIFVPSGDSEKYEAGLAAPEQVVMRFSDDNDGAQYTFGMFYRTCKTAEAAADLVRRSTRSRYMGRKRHTWFAVKSEVR